MSDKVTLMAGITIAGAALTAFLFLDERHVHPVDVVQQTSAITQRMMVSDTTRYAQIIKYYVDVQKERPLTKPESLRLDLAQRELERIHAILVEK